MKKHNTMKLAALILVLTLITAMFAGNTLAKYVTVGDPSQDSARVAKWGVSISSDGEAFATEYAKDSDTEIDITVKSSTEDKVVAPGTRGELAGIAISGTPEVAVAINLTADLALSGWAVPGFKDVVVSERAGYYTAASWKTPDGWNVALGSSPENSHYRQRVTPPSRSNYHANDVLDPPEDPTVQQSVIAEVYEGYQGRIYNEETGVWENGTFPIYLTTTWYPPVIVTERVPAEEAYCPISITVGDQVFNGLDYETTDEFEAAVEAAITGFSAEYAPNTDLAGANLPAISWEWAFEGNDDAKDTILGNLEVAPTISLTVGASAVQID